MLCRSWHFKAKNVRDFAFASSRKFIWDAQVTNQDADVVAQYDVLTMVAKQWPLPAEG